MYSFKSYLTLKEFAEPAGDDGKPEKQDGHAIALGLAKEHAHYSGKAYGQTHVVSPTKVHKNGDKTTTITFGKQTKRIGLTPPNKYVITSKSRKVGSGTHHKPGTILWDHEVHIHRDGEEPERHYACYNSKT